MVILTIALTAMLCLVFKSTRLIGVVGMAIFFLLQPLLCFALFVVGGIAIYFIYYHRKERHEYPKLFD